MRYLAAYLLLVIAGVSSPDAAGIRKVLDAAGVETDDERLEKLLGELEGKDINEVSCPSECPPIVTRVYIYIPFFYYS